MQKKLTKHGDSLAIVIEKPILELLGADADTTFDVTTDGHALVLSPVGSEERQRAFKEVLERTTEKYAETFRRLAE